MPKCNKFEAHAIDYVYGELNTSQKFAFEQHLTACDHCVRKVNEFKYVLHLVDEAEEELTSHAIAPNNLQIKLYKRLAAAPPDKPTLRSRVSEYFSRFIFILREQKAASICLFFATVVAVAFFVGNPFRPDSTFTVSHTESADARIEQYRHQGIQRSMEDVLRHRHLRNADKLDITSQLNRVKEQAQGTDLANIASKL
jgi:anti-sigma factor RsiW